MFNRSMKVLACAALTALVGAVTTQASAAVVTYSLMATGISNGTGTVSADGKTVSVTSGAGSIISLSLYLNIHGTDGNHANDGGLNIAGGFTSSNGNLLGNFSTGTNVSGFDGLTSSGGTTFDVDGDGDLDVGEDVAWKTATATPVPDRSFVAASTDADTGVPTFGTGSGTGDTQLLIGTTTFTLTGSFGTTTLQFIPHLPSSGTDAERLNQEFEVDGIDYAVDATGAGLAGSLFGSGNSVSDALDISGLTISTIVPEPTSLGLIWLSGVAMMRRRRTVAGGLKGGKMNGA